MSLDLDFPSIVFQSRQSCTTEKFSPDSLMPNFALITGASRGIGIHFVKCILSNSSLSVIATARDPTDIKRNLQGFDYDPNRLVMLPMDVCE